NAVDYGAAYRPELQDPTRDQATPGANAFSENLLRPYRGLSEIDQETQRHHRTYHSIQMSLQRRFLGGVAGGFNYTLSLSDKTNEGTQLRFEHGDDGSIRVRDDQEAYEALLENAGLRRHVLK